MNIQQLRYARALAERGSFVQAAIQCGVTQPTLSNGIAQLEVELGQQLFARTTRTVRLTVAGHHLLGGIVNILDAQAALLANAYSLSHPERRFARIGVSPIVGVAFVALVIEPFRHENPDIEVVFREMNVSEMMTSLQGGQLDVVVGPVDAERPGLSNFAGATFRNEPLVFVPSSGTKAKYLPAKVVALGDIADETFVMVPDTCGLTRMVRALFKRARLPLKEYSGSALSYAVLQEWAELGIGSAILPRSKLHDSKGSEIQIFDGSDSVRIQYFSLWPDGPNTRPEAKSLAKFFKEVVPAIVQGLAH